MTDADGGLRHLAFFEELGKMDESDAAWRSVSAGLVVMRLVDNWIEGGGAPSRVDSWGVSSVREAIAEIEGKTPLTRMLTGIVDALVSSPVLDLHVLIPRLMAYGQTLQYDAKWALAADVYRTIVGHAHQSDDTDLIVTALLQLGFCHRTLDEFDDATAAYAAASRLALASGDMVGVLRGRLGDARIAVARGNLPYADAVVEDTIAEAQASGFHEIHALALGDRAGIAGFRGQYDRAIRYSYEALKLTLTPRDKDRALVNIATGFRLLGLLDIARDAYLVLAATAQEQYVRWMSELHLMELSAAAGMELQFDRYRRELESADFSPLLRVMYLLHVGRGYHSLGNSTAGIAYLADAVKQASAN
ncbi:MAG: hypothetical protein ABI205_00235, partial [Gemmatimonadaceae bacterium]